MKMLLKLLNLLIVALLKRLHEIFLELVFGSQISHVLLVSCQCLIDFVLNCCLVSRLLLLSFFDLVLYVLVVFLLQTMLDIELVLQLLQMDIFQVFEALLVRFLCLRCLDLHQLYCFLQCLVFIDDCVLKCTVLVGLLLHLDGG